MPLQGPIRDDAGALIRVPLGVDVAALPLVAGRYRLVPVDGNDRAVEDAEPVEVVVPATLLGTDPRPVMLELMTRVAARMQHDETLVQALQQHPFPEDLRAAMRASGMRIAPELMEAMITARSPERREAAFEAAVSRIEELWRKLASHVLRGVGRPPADPQVPLTTAAIRALVAEPLRCTIDRVLHSALRLDYEDAVARAIARVRAGMTLPAPLLGQLLPGIDEARLLLGLVAIATGDRASEMLTALAQRRFPPGPHADSLDACALFAAWRLGALDETRDALVRHARRIARRPLSPLGRALVWAVVDGIDDPALTEVAKLYPQPSREEQQSAIVLADKLLRFSIDQLIDDLAANERRSGESVAPTRNAPCPCGSGKKYKRCCGDRENPEPLGTSNRSTALPSARPPVPPGRLTFDDVWQLPLREIVARSLAQDLDPAALPAMSLRFADAHQWALAAATADTAAKLATAPGQMHGDVCRASIVEAAVRAGELEIAIEQLNQMSNPAHVAIAERIALALARGEPVVALMQEHHASLLDPHEARRLASALMRTVPVLGVLIGRGCIFDQPDFTVESILDEIERVRDELVLAPFDPAWRLTEKLRPGAEAAEAERVRARLHELTNTLVEQSMRLDAARQRIDELQTELDRVRPPAPIAPAAPVEPEQLRAMRSRIEELEALIREGNSERAELRRALAATTTNAPASADGAEQSSEPDEEPGDAVHAPVRRVLVPVVGEGVTGALRVVPPHVAAEAMRTVGQLAAGDRNSWRGVKQVKDLDPPAFTVRVGIHHRLLFQVDEDRLYAFDLVTRENLTTTLKRLRAARGRRAL